MASKLYFLMLGWHELSIGTQIYHPPLIADGDGHAAMACNLGDNSGCLEVRSGKCSFIGIFYSKCDSEQVHYCPSFPWATR